MIFTDGQRRLFMDRATQMLERMKAFSKGEKIDLRDGYQISLVTQYFEEICSIGYSIAMDAVHSTPWEWLTTTAGEAAMDNVSSLGWEYVGTYVEQKDMRLAPEARILWRRRKAVIDAQIRETMD